MPWSTRRSFAPSRPKLALAVLLAFVLLGSAAGGVRAASAATDLGPPSYAAYCRSIGFVDTRFTSGPNKTWGCLHSDGSVTALDIQAACEFSYAQRPILAQELTPGAIYTWHCIQTSGSGTPGSASPSSAQLKAALLAAIAPSGRAARISALLKRGYADRFHALVGGRVSISWYLVPKGARLAKTHPVPVLVATGARTISAAGATTIKIALTTRGRRVLARSRRLRLTGRGVFTPRGGHAVKALKTFTLKR
jgi:hypothetical protein